MSGTIDGLRALPLSGKLVLAATVGVGLLVTTTVALSGSPDPVTVTAAQAPTTPAATVATAPAPTPPTASAAASPAASTAPPSPSPTPSTTAPVVRTEQEVVVEAVPFDVATREDPNADQGTRQVVTAGSNGERTLTYEVTYTDGVETDRRLVADDVTREPVDEVVSVGTRQPQAAAPAPAPGGACDPNYSGCVPIASDVDCAGGSGNGPAYASGPITVIGSDVYDLDRDGDGVACE